MTVIRVTNGDARLVGVYLPENYRVSHTEPDGKVIVIGTDVAGWTADDYVVPRLRSGLMFGEVIQR